MSIAIGTFIQFNENTDKSYQNFFVGDEVFYDGFKYFFAGFGYSGSTIDLEASNVDATLVWAANDLSLNLAAEAAEKRWTVNIQSVWLKDDLTIDKSYMTDTFMVTGFEHDTLRLSMRLSSPLDSVGADAPRRRLTEQLVGALPSTGQVALL